MSSSRSRSVRIAAALLPVLASAMMCCRRPAPPLTLPAAAAAGPPGHIAAVLINGGGRKEVNFQSHLTNVRSMLDVLHGAGVAAHDITIFSGDGADPAADQATRTRTSEDELWLIPRTGVGAMLRPPVTYVDSAVAGYDLRPAVRKELHRWFAEQGQELAPGDTLLLYVTDHGERSKEDLADNTIVLWGESLSVSELRELIGLLDPEVRVLMVMSQCFSGAFANLILPPSETGDPATNVCGYFASTADRPAYGCYPENLGKDGVGHSFHMFEAVREVGTLPEAHRRTLVTDDSPDVPHTTADFFLARLIEKKAKEKDLALEAFADRLIAEAWEHKKDWEPEIRLLDRIGQAFGVFSPRSLAELKKQADALPVVSDQLRTYGQRWREAKDALVVENADRFFEAEPDWRARLDMKILKDLDPDARGALAHELLDRLEPFTKKDRERHGRLVSLRERAEEASQAGYRMEVRLGVVLRMRMILLDIAGREYLARYGTPAERDTYAELLACESLRLDPLPPVRTAAELPPPPSFPALVEDQRVAEAVMPAWMGIRYRPLQDEEQKKTGMGRGAVTVMTVYPDSPAQEAGLHVGDLILGPPGQRFAEPNQVREWTMRSEVGTEYPLEVQRESEILQVALRPDPYPLKFPELPGPPKVGSAAPPVKVELVRGTGDLESKHERLLFFWATWCLPCKASLPEVMAFSSARHVEVVAITDEPPELVRKFLQDFAQPFPEIVATDRLRETFQTYGVSGTPTFVLIDDENNVRYYKSGYAPKAGLGIEGWKFEPEKKEAKG